MKLLERDSEEVASWSDGEDAYAELHHIGGVDISFDKETPNSACAMLCVLSFPPLEVLHVSSALVEMTEPYIPGFLAFREVGFLVELLESVRQQCPHLTPQVIMVDGNGVLHPRGEFDASQRVNLVERGAREGERKGGERGRGERG